MEKNLHSSPSLPPGDGSDSRSRSLSEIGRSLSATALALARDQLSDWLSSGGGAPPELGQSPPRIALDKKEVPRAKDGSSAPDPGLLGLRNVPVPRDKLISPMCASLEMLSKLPPVHLVVSLCDWQLFLIESLLQV